MATHVDKDGIFLYSRINFDGAGQDSYQTPPAQDEEMFELLENVLPPVRGDFQRRWGYRLFNNPSLTARRMYEFQDNAGSRRIVLTNSAGIESLNEDGTAHNTGIFTPGGGARHPRMVMSRDYGFFADGVEADLKKWDGDVSGGIGVQKWGIAAASITSSGPANPTAAVGNDTTFGGSTAWNNPGNVFSSNNVDADGTWNGAACGGPTTTQTLRASGFGFAIPAGAEIIGILVEVEAAGTNADCGMQAADLQWGAALGKAGSLIIGSDKSEQTTITGTDTYYSFGSSTDLWGQTWTAGDVNDTGFSVGVHASAVNATLTVDHIRVTVYYKAAIAVANGGAGSITLVSGRKYTYAYKSSVTGHISDIAPFSASTGPITTDDIDLSGITAASDTQVDRKIVLATADGGDETLLYELVDLPNATTTYTDDIPEEVLLTRNIYLEVDDFGREFGLAENDPPPNGDFPIKHRGRLYMAVGQLLYFSKAIDELATSTGIIAGRWEEAWPGDYFIDVSEGAETIRGLLSDGQVLYIGTERRVMRLFGDGPDTFSKPEIAFNDVGVLNQDVWQPVFREGSPIGVMWLTPDLRLVMSDMNSYVNVGTPVQDVLDSLNLTHASKAWARYVGIGEYNLYVLAIPTGANTEPDTLVVYDLRRGRFVTWQPTDDLTAGLYNLNASGNARFIVGAATGKVYRFDPSGAQDRLDDTPVSFTATLRTSFQHFGNPLYRKTLEWLQVLTGDSGLLVSVAGASTAAEFASPTAVVTDSAIAASPLGDYRVELAGSVTKDRSYRMQFKSTGTATELLSGWYCRGNYEHTL